jgi:hypothetical protein
MLHPHKKNERLEGAGEVVVPSWLHEYPGVRRAPGSTTEKEFEWHSSCALRRCLRRGK